MKELEVGKNERIARERLAGEAPKTKPAGLFAAWTESGRLDQNLL
jgi:hypothetical protein